MTVWWPGTGLVLCILYHENLVFGETVENGNFLLSVLMSALNLFLESLFENV